MNARGAIVVAAVVIAAVAVAHAGEPAPNERLKSLYLESTKHYQLGEYREALTGYTEAYRLKADPAFLYNIAQCYRQVSVRRRAS